MSDTLTADAFTERLEELAGDTGHVASYAHADGSVTVVMYDPVPGDCESPRDDDGNVATLIQENSRCIAVDTDDAGLAEAHDRWDYRGGDVYMARYLAAFRPDIAAYVNRWDAGDSYGWGYVTREALAAAGFSDDRETLSGTLQLRAGTLFDAEVAVYRQWADGEVCCAHHLTRGQSVTVADYTGATPAGTEVSEDTVYGFLGYDNLADIAASFTDSPVTGEL